MSMQQAGDYKAMCLQAEGIEDVTSRVFIYDLPAEFEKQLPDARFRAAACVKGWVFHVNVQGRANIRQSFQSEVYPSSDYLLAGPCRKSIYDPTRKNFDVLGLIYDLTPEQAARCAKYFHIDRNRVNLIATIEDRETLEVQSIAVSAYVDLRNTADGLKKVFPDDPTNHLYELWKLNFGMFEQAGISKAYLNATFKQLVGKSIPYPEPIYVAPALLSQYPDHVSSPPASVTHPRLDATSSQSPQSRPVARPPFQGSSQITWQYVGITKFKAYFEASIPACPNDTVCRKLEDQYNAGLKSYREHQEQLLAQREERLMKQRAEEQWSDEGECTTDEGEQLADEEEQLIEEGGQLTGEDEWLTERWLTEEGEMFIVDEDLLTEEEEQLTEEGGQLTDEGGQLTEDEELLTEEDELSTDEEELLTEEEEWLPEEDDQLSEEEGQLTDEEEQRAEEEKQRAEEEKQRAEEEKQRAEEEKQRAEEERKRAWEQKQREIWERLVKRVREQKEDDAAAEGEARGRTHPAEFNSASKSLSLDDLPVMGELSAPRSRFSGQARPQVYPPQSQDPHTQQPRRTEPSLQAANAQLLQAQKPRTQIQQPGPQIQQSRPQVQQPRVQQPQHSTGGQNPAQRSQVGQRPQHPFLEFMNSSSGSPTPAQLQYSQPLYTSHNHVQRIPAGPQNQHPLPPPPISRVQAPPRRMTLNDLPAGHHYSEPTGGPAVFRLPANYQGPDAQSWPKGQHILSRSPQSTNGGQNSAQRVPAGPPSQHAQPTSGGQHSTQRSTAGPQGQYAQPGPQSQHILSRSPQSTNGGQNSAQRVPAGPPSQHAQPTSGGQHSTQRSPAGPPSQHAQPTNGDRAAFQQLIASLRGQQTLARFPQSTNGSQNSAQRLPANPQGQHAQPTDGDRAAFQQLLATVRVPNIGQPLPQPSQPINGGQLPTSRPSQANLPGPQSMVGLQSRPQASQPRTRNPLHPNSFYNDAQPSRLLQQPRRQQAHPRQPRPRQPRAASTPSPGRQAPRSFAPQPEDEEARR
ncbi:hypothetical protein LZ554_007362 [Drepanopeziza brunnea f. sp. 'monogermtubi']|nr:hypothetical protein LZ554_007362 [Drepanopeziza brunnea f. sp. 'monogermtubi']